jgi:hypothetical protein
MRVVVCFLVLPILPTLAFLLLCACPIPIFRDRIVVIVLTAVLATLASATVGFRVRRKPLAAVL